MSVIFVRPGIKPATEASPHCEAPVVIDPANQLYLPDAGCLGIHLGYGGRQVKGHGFLCNPHADYIEKDQA